MASSVRSGTVQARTAHPMAPFTVIAIAASLLLGIGLVLVASASSMFAYKNMGSSYALTARQLLFAGFGSLGMWALSRMHPDSIRRLTRTFMFVVLIMLVVVLGIGSAVHGQRNWINIWGPFRVQPSEFAKLAVVMFGADVVARRQHLIEQPKHLLKTVVPMYVVVLVLIIAEGDLGTGIVMMPIMASVLFFSGAPYRWFIGMIAVGSAAIAGLSILHPYRMARFTSWANQGADPDGTGFQLTHGYYALATGGWGGLGPGASREKWGTLPEAHTDFIFAVLGEEYGVIGTLIVLALFIALIVSAVQVAMNSTDRFVQLTSTGIATWIATQLIVNVGAVLGVLPITGVPLPLVSYGGSSLIPTLLAMGILLSFARNTASR